MVARFGAQPRQQPRQPQSYGGFTSTAGTYQMPTAPSAPTVPQGPTGEPDYGIGVGNIPTYPDIGTQYAELLAQIQGQRSPAMPGVATNSAQYNETMRMYQQQMADQAAMQQRILAQYDPSIGSAQHDALMELYQPVARRDQALHLWGY